MVITERNPWATRYTPPRDIDRITTVRVKWGDGGYHQAVKEYAVRGTGDIAIGRALAAFRADHRLAGVKVLIGLEIIT